MVSCRVEYVNTEKGYGFAKCEGYSDSVFIHAREIKGKTLDDLKKGDLVNVSEVAQGDKGLFAKDVR